MAASLFLLLSLNALRVLILVMKKICAFAFVLFSLLFAATSVQAAFGDWRPTQGDLYEALRANAPFYWKWLKQNAGADFYQARGVVTGDAHILNFGDIELAGGGRAYGLIDMDDSGTDVPLLGDYLHYYVGNQLSAYKVSDTDLWQAYVQGLSGHRSHLPDLLKEMLKKTDADFAKAQTKQIDKLTNGDRFSDKAGLSSVGEAPGEIQDMYQKVEAEILRQMAGYQILDGGYKVKEDGGSQGLARFWFLLARGKERHIWEFKQETEPATSLYSPQSADPVTRFQTVARIYRPYRAPLGPYKFLQAGDGIFLLREHLSSFIKLDPTRDKDSQSLKDGKELAIYLAHQLGLWQSVQPGGAQLLHLIQRDSKAAKKSLDQLGQTYIEEMKRQQGI